MSFDERMDRLVERQEALTQSVEIHHAMLTRLEAMQAEHNLALSHQRETMDGLMTATGRLLTATDRLVQVSNQHESRLTKLEGRA